MSDDAPRSLEEMLEAISLALPKELLRKIKKGEATAADLNVARQLLKDNGFMSMPEANPHLANLGSKLGDVKLAPMDYQTVMGHDTSDPG